VTTERTTSKGLPHNWSDPAFWTQAGFIESFNGNFREYCLDLNWFASLEDARATIEDWRKYYNHVRPHRLPGSKPPAVFASEAA